MSLYCHKPVYNFDLFINQLNKKYIYMKKVLFTLVSGLALLLLQSGYSQTIVGSSHDFSARAWNTSVGGQICVVCHTPHNASLTVTDAPLWNHATTTATFSLYTSSTLNGTLGQPDASSKLCLSCHDGTVALSNFGTTTTGTHFISGADLLGTELKNDHPVSFTYDAALATADGGLRNPITAASGLGGTINQNMLFGGKMQCASCHDVHNSAGVSNLLVKANTASALCLTCHSK
jgi:predicted CXXCH cytochrome family protein